MGWQDALVARARAIGSKAVDVLGYVIERLDPDAEADWVKVPASEVLAASAREVERRKDEYEKAKARHAALVGSVSAMSSRLRGSDAKQ